MTIEKNYNKGGRPPKTALALLYKLENATKEPVATNRKIEELTREFEEKYLTK